MKIKSGKLFVTASMTIFLITTGIVSSYAWYKSEAQGNASSAMGAVEVFISSDSTQVNDEDSLSFTIVNRSNIETYMRLGWTPVYRKMGSDLAKDTRGISVTATVTKESPDGLAFTTGVIKSLNEYEKNTFILEDDEYKYFVVPAGADISGTITVKGHSLSDGESFHLILVPEAIQATWRAVDEAQPYGWDTAKVGKQAGTIVDPPYTGEQGGGGDV